MYTATRPQAMQASTASKTKKIATLIGELTLAPGQDAKLPLGTFDAEEEQPSFVLTYSPGTSQDVKASLVRLKDDSNYRLIYFFQSFSDRTSHVTVQQIQA